MEHTPHQVPSEENERKAASILQQIADLGAQVFFEKPLTASDASGSGRVVIPKAIAEQYFPRLEQPSGLPVRAVDIRGHEYTFKFRFWINNQSRMYLLEGAGELHRQFTMSVGDVMVFAQKMDKTLVVAGRPATKNDVIRKAPVKRPAGEAGAGGGKGKSREPKAKVPKGPAGAQQQQQPPGAQQRRKKPAPDDPAVDGIFRAAGFVPPLHPGGVAQSKSGRWVVTLNLAGELYQALFDTQEDALEAFNAAGGLPAKPGAEGTDMAAVTAAAAAASDMAQAALAAAAAAVGGGGSGSGAAAGGGNEDEEMADADGAGNQ